MIVVVVFTTALLRNTVVFASCCCLSVVSAEEYCQGPSLITCMSTPDILLFCGAFTSTAVLFS